MNAHASCSTADPREEILQLFEKLIFQWKWKVSVGVDELLSDSRVGFPEPKSRHPSSAQASTSVVPESADILLALLEKSAHSQVLAEAILHAAKLGIVSGSIGDDPFGKAKRTREAETAAKDPKMDLKDILEPKPSKPVKAASSGPKSLKAQISKSLKRTIIPNDDNRTRKIPKTVVLPPSKSKMRIRLACLCLLVVLVRSDQHPDVQRLLQTSVDDIAKPFLKSAHVPTKLRDLVKSVLFEWSIRIPQAREAIALVSVDNMLGLEHQLASVPSAIAFVSETLQIMESLIQEAETAFALVTSGELALSEADDHEEAARSAAISDSFLARRDPHDAIVITTELHVDENNAPLVDALRESLFVLSKKRNLLDLLVIEARRLSAACSGPQKENATDCLDRVLMVKSNMRRIFQAALVMGIKISNPHERAKPPKEGNANSDDEWNDVVFEVVPVP